MAQNQGMESRRGQFGGWERDNYTAILGNETKGFRNWYSRGKKCIEHYFNFPYVSSAWSYDKHGICLHGMVLG
jgi:hypothetical protein